ncbi:uncharacterized protein LOC117258361 [Epinephelus lanceolatus]
MDNIAKHLANILAPLVGNTPHHIQNSIDFVNKKDLAEHLKSLLEKKAADILNEYQQTGTLSTSSRKKLVKLSVSDLVEKYGFYPPAAEKLHLAKSLITLFTALKMMVSGEGDGFEHFYDPLSHKGFIEIKLRNIRQNLEEGQRRYLKRKLPYSAASAAQPSVDEDPSEWLAVIKRMKASPENMAPIKTAMEKTFSYCRNWISTQSPTLTDTVQQYPRFIDIPSLLDTEFGKMFEGKAELFIRRWESSIIPKLRKFAVLEKGVVSTLIEQNGDQNDDEECYRMLQVLTHVLPPTASGRGAAVSGRCSVKSALSYLLDFVPHGTSIPSLCDRDEGSLTTHQPQLVCIGALTSQARQFVIVARNDKVTIPLHDDSLTFALDKLFRFYWVCNVAYPTQLVSVFIFLEHIYDLPVSKTVRRSRVLELIDKLQALA